MLLSSLVSALGAHAVVQASQPLSVAEYQALDALIDYVAVRGLGNAANENLIRHSLCSQFGIKDMRELPTGDYEAAVLYLLQLAK